MKRAVIFSGCAFEKPDWVTLPKDAMILCADSGLRHARALGISPDWVLGDFDSSSEHPEGESVLRYPPEKDDTDTELAIKRALAMNCSHITLLGATGGRLDHMIGNIHLLFPCLQKGTYAEIVDSQNRLYLIDGEHTFRKGETWGKYISFLPLTEEVKGITLRGFKYPLTDRDISIGTSLCISNELVEEEGTITFSDGVLITVESHD